MPKRLPRKMKTDKIQKADMIISGLRFFAIIAAAVACIILKKLPPAVALRLLLAYALAELFLQNWLNRKNRRVPHVLLFELQSGIFTAVLLYCMNRPKMDLFVCLGITAFVAAFLLLCFPILYRRRRRTKVL